MSFIPGVSRARKGGTVRKRVLLLMAAAAVLTLVVAQPAAAQDADPAATVATNLNLLWVVIGAVLVIFMQAGFALVETGFCRAKHAAHVVATNFAVFALGFVGFYLVGYSFMFGGFTLPVIGMTIPTGTHLIGSGNWIFLWQGGWAGSGKAFYTPGAMAFFLYMVAFMDTTATIPTGAMAERWKWKAFVGWGLFCGAVYYPMFGAWTWGGGWLAKLGQSAHWGLGYADFAGSGVVHAMGGVAGLAGAIVLGPRIGKFAKDGTPRALPGHHIPMAMLGTFILLFGWFGFNAASTFSVADTRFAVVALNTAIAAAFGAASAMVYMMFVDSSKKPDPGMMANGMLAGLVAITAPCAFVQPWAAMVIGIIAGVLVIISVRVIEHKFKIDDPVGAISVHGVCGLFGVISVGIFADGQYGGGWNGTVDANGDALSPGGKGIVGILYDGHGWGQLASQLAGAVTICVAGFIVSYAFFKIQDKVMKGGIRSSEEEELVGLDLPEMGVLAYPEFGGHGGFVSSSSEV
jgi:Amt family ammonium transporter